MTIESFKDANLAILDFYEGGLADWTPFQIEKLRGIISSPIPPEQVSHFTEFVYANRASLQPSMLVLAADVAGFAAANGFYGLGEDARGFRIAAALRGEAIPELPEPKADWVELASDDQKPNSVLQDPAPPREPDQGEGA